MCLLIHSDRVRIWGDVSFSHPLQSTSSFVENRYHAAFRSDVEIVPTAVQRKYIRAGTYGLLQDYPHGEHIRHEEHVIPIARNESEALRGVNDEAVVVIAAGDGVTRNDASTRWVD